MHDAIRLDPWRRTWLAGVIDCAHLAIQRPGLSMIALWLWRFAQSTLSGGALQPRIESR